MTMTARLEGWERRRIRLQRSAAGMGFPGGGGTEVVSSQRRRTQLRQFEKDNERSSRQILLWRWTRRRRRMILTRMMTATTIKTMLIKTMRRNKIKKMMTKEGACYSTYRLTATRDTIECILVKFIHHSHGVIQPEAGMAGMPSHPPPGQQCVQQGHVTSLQSATKNVNV
jgi:hypothetical protein